MELIKFDPNVIDTKTINLEGRSLYETNPFFKSLANVMENPEFMKLFTNYFDSWDNIELFVMFAKVYDSITKQFPEMTGYEKIALVKKLVDNSKTRRIMCQEIKQFRKSTDIINMKKNMKLLN
jgi:hypothetical protein